jgi:hypothetical protein
MLPLQARYRGFQSLTVLQSSRSQPWRHRLYSALPSTCEHYLTHPYLVDILLNGINAWFHYVPFVKTKYPSIFHHLMDKQTSLGWRQIFQGRMSLEWSRLQDQHLLQIKSNSNSLTGTLWTTNIITTVWKAFFTMWTARNTAIHGADSKSRQKSRIHPSRHPPKPRYTTCKHIRNDRNQVQKKRPPTSPTKNHIVS